MKSDKGNATVVKDKIDYEEKMLMLLADNKTYERIDSKVNLLKSVEKELNKLLWQLVKEEKITSPVYSTLKCIKGVTPKINGLPKVHKVNLPLRPIVAFIGSPTYNLSKFLIHVLVPLLKQTYSVKNSAQFVNIVNDLICNNLHCSVSFDVVSLFTSIPTSDVLNLFFRLLNQDNFLCDRTNLSVNDIIEALSICLKSTVFSFKNVLYRQTFGAPKGSCISPILADIFLEFVEHRTISTFHTPPKLWVRYVDDTFCVIEQQYAEEFHKHLNSISPSITFTPERRQNHTKAGIMNEQDKCFYHNITK